MSVCIEACARSLEREILAKTRSHVITMAQMADIYRRMLVLVTAGVKEGKFETRADVIKQYLHHFAGKVAEL